ncbi:putative eggshell protein [Glossina fuscipes]|uniref:Eggshell protein n=1 Tax=Glossina fuscipes TaxID=7396 RepID=A0A9C5Z5F3_9MUSC|nr:putative eggshell protein [Glossina fuscipes]KAI9581430.1 hypothetical protein GQX74_012755 [Glossina fuscipes]
MQLLASSIFLVTVFGSALVVSVYGHYTGHASLSKYDFKGYEKHHASHHIEDHDHDHDSYSHPKYEFDYSVKDLKSGDNKKHWEERDGDKVKGHYSFTEADGTTRVVEYSADKHNGFQAIVKHVGHATHDKVEDLKSHHSKDHHKHHHHHYNHRSHAIH